MDGFKKQQVVMIAVGERARVCEPHLCPEEPERKDEEVVCARDKNREVVVDAFTEPLSIALAVGGGEVNSQIPLLCRGLKCYA